MEEYHKNRKIVKNTYKGDRKIKDMTGNGKKKQKSIITTKGCYVDKTAVPAITIQGLILSKKGFNIGTEVTVNITDEAIIIRKIKCVR